MTYLEAFDVIVNKTTPFEPSELRDQAIDLVFKACVLQEAEETKRLKNE